MRNAFVLTVFAVFYLPIIGSSIRRATECSPELKSRALIVGENYDAAPGKLGAMLLERSEGMLSADERKDSRELEKKTKTGHERLSMDICRTEDRETDLSHDAVCAGLAAGNDCEAHLSRDGVGQK